MARPLFNPQQSLVGEIIQSLERHNPRFVWIQFLFAQRDSNHLLLNAKAELENYVRHAKLSDYDERTKRKIPKKENSSQWYKLAVSKIKKIEKSLPRPTIIFAINGMWVANNSEGSEDAVKIQELPFSLCSDGYDRLKGFIYKDPRILRMLVERRMVTDISPSVYRYGRSRDEPPSLIFSPDEIPYYIHMPTGASAKGLTSVNPSAHFPVGGTLKAQGLMPLTAPLKTKNSEDQTLDIVQKRLTITESPNFVENVQTQVLPQFMKRSQRFEDTFRKLRSGPSVAALKKIPTIEDQLDENDAQRLSNVISHNIRTFEIVYDSEGGKGERFKPKALTTLMLSSSSVTSKDDLQKVYIPQLESVYGKIDYELVSDRRPGFIVKELRNVVNL